MPRLYDPLPTPTEMAAWDRAAIKDYGIKGEILMENASREAMTVLTHECAPLEGKSAVVFAGPGNNGGDGFAIARHLSNRGAAVVVLHTRPKRDYKGDAGYHLRLASSHGVRLKHLTEGDLQGLADVDIVVDALLGTGFSGTLRPQALDIVRTINDMGRRAFVLAVDIPSGLDGRTGRPGPEAVRANATVTFEAAKTGLVQPGAAQYVGQLYVQEIGIPAAVKKDFPTRTSLLRDGVLDLVPSPKPESHKGSFANVLVVGGSRGMSGAPRLAAMGALRAGAGLVSVACPAGIADQIATAMPEVMTIPVGTGDVWDESCLEDLFAALNAENGRRFDAVALGPGMGRNPEARRVVEAWLEADTPPTVYDADALFHLARLGSPDTGPHSVLTPHPGEMARLAGTTTAQVQEDRMQCALDFTADRSCVLALKGAETVICEAGRVFLSPFMEPTLAVGGSGDILAGITASLLGGGLDPLQSTCVGVYWHGFSGSLLSRDYPRRGNTPMEIANALPRAAKERAC